VNTVLSRFLMGFPYVTHRLSGWWDWNPRLYADRAFCKILLPESRRLAFRLKVCVMWKILSLE